jgi:hypothetical protein
LAGREHSNEIGHLAGAGIDQDWNAENQNANPHGLAFLLRNSWWHGAKANHRDGKCRNRWRRQSGVDLFISAWQYNILIGNGNKHFKAGSDLRCAAAKK